MYGIIIVNFIVAYFIEHQIGRYFTSSHEVNIIERNKQKIYVQFVFKVF